MYWSAKDENGKTVYAGSFPNQNIPTGNNTVIGNLAFPTDKFEKATQLAIEAGIEGTSYTNEWNVWVYPTPLTTLQTDDFYTTDRLEARAEKVLSDGGKVLLLGAGKVVKGKEVIQSFMPVFWNTFWFKMRPLHTLGFVVKNNSPVFRHFSTSYHPDLQWRDVVKGAKVLHLEDFPENFRPLVQPIDT